jgi:hypothetical protein
MTSIPQTPVPDTSSDAVTSVRDQVVWLLNQVEESIQHIHGREMGLRRWAGSIRVVTLVLSGLVTIALGIRWPAYSELLRNVGFVLGAISTVIVSLDLYFNYRGLWVEHEEAEWRLHRLKDRIKFYLEGRTDDQLNAATISGFHESYQWIWDNLSKHWLAMRQASHK